MGAPGGVGGLPRGSEGAGRVTRVFVAPGPWGLRVATVRTAGARAAAGRRRGVGRLLPPVLQTASRTARVWIFFF